MSDCARFFDSCFFMGEVGKEEAFFFFFCYYKSLFNKKVQYENVHDPIFICKTGVERGHVEVVDFSSKHSHSLYSSQGF